MNGDRAQCKTVRESAIPRVPAHKQCAPGRSLAEAFLQLATVIVTHQQLMVGEGPAVGERLN